MTPEYFREIYQLARQAEEDQGWPDYTFPAQAIFLGLQIVAKYLPMKVVIAAEHDVICSALVDDLGETDITAEEITELVQLGWRIGDHDGLEHFV